MAYTELVKKFNRIREYMREFYVYGFKSRDEYKGKSARTYDDERRRIESWLGDYMKFTTGENGKSMFLSIDARETSHNPLYKAWKAKSFTDGDITLHFLLLDILKEASSRENKPTLAEIMAELDERLAGFRAPRTFDESTVRKKLKEYTEAGIVVTTKEGKKVHYSEASCDVDFDVDAVHFFSEVSPCGVVGDFLMDKVHSHQDILNFKHHYITGALDSEIAYRLFKAMGEKRAVTLENINRRRGSTTKSKVVPLRIMISAQSGRQYLMAYEFNQRRIKAYRLDNIESVSFENVSDRFDELRKNLEKMEPHMWGVSTASRHGERMEHVEFTIKYGKHEQHIPRRLEREKRFGMVTYGDGFCKFEADVYDSGELIPWIRTFICRITEIKFSNKKIEEEFKSDIREMYRLYGLESGLEGGDDFDI